MKFKTVTHENREEWLQWRHNGIGSSDVPVIMGVSRFKTIDQLFAEKTAPIAQEDDDNGYIKDRGNRIEMTVRRYFEEATGLEFKPMACIDEKYPHRIATLDGIDDGKNVIIEIKLLTTQKESAPNQSAAGYVKWKTVKYGGAIPDDYYPQIQHQLSVTGIPSCVFLGYKETRHDDHIPRPVTAEDVADTVILPDVKYIADMNKKIDAFWKKVLQERERLAKVAKKEKKNEN